ncbi:MAG: MoxR family ATPase, partial [Mycobacterium sp.]
MTSVLFASPDDVISRFDAQDYLLDTGTASAIYLAVTLGRPLLLEGEPGVGKTTAAKTLAAVLDTPLVRLQCYEGLTANEALYD